MTEFKNTEKPIGKGKEKDFVHQIPVLKVLGLNPNGITKEKVVKTTINKGKYNNHN